MRDLRPAYQDLAVNDPSADLYKRDTDACCRIRKVLPLDRALQDFDVWITGRKRFQSATRLSLPVVEVGEGKLKFNPAAQLVGRRPEVGRLTPRTMPCRPTPAVGPRLSLDRLLALHARRWRRATTPAPAAGRGEDKSECGIHVTRATPPSNDGVGGELGGPVPGRVGRLLHLIAVALTLSVRADRVSARPSLSRNERGSPRYLRRRRPDRPRPR